MSRREALGGIAGLGLAALGPAVQPTAASQDEAVAVSVRPGERSVKPGTEATFDVVVENAVNGISAVSAELSVSDADVATPTDVELTKETSLSDAEFSDGAVTVEAAMGDNTFDPAAEIVPMTVTVETQSPGTTELRIDTATFTDADNETYAVGQTTDATVTVDSDEQGGDDEQAGDDGEEQSGGSAGDGEDGADDGTDGEANGGEQRGDESTENGDESAENGGDESADGGDSDEDDGADGGGDEGSGGTPTDGTDDGEDSSENGSATDDQGESSQDDTEDGDENAAASGDDDSTDGTTADDDGPGFGIATGLASLGALGYGLLRRGSSTEREEQ
ncbi:hypothetical protein BRC66_04105 [Halobacteriales archaeon QH_2_66_30]|nr:MAG: hypothetical protein BRC66_04105 [Halobacteriales archaeon QH_2_66_30]